MIKISSVRHLWPEKSGFVINRPGGHPEYTFLHFLNSVDIVIDGVKQAAPAGSVIIFRPHTTQFFVSEINLLHNWFHFTAESEDELLRYGIEVDKLYNVNDGDFITKSVRTLENEFFSPKTLNEEFIDLKVKELFLGIARSIAGESAARIEKSLAKRFDDLREEVFSNLDMHWTVELMAEKVGLSKSRFYTVYKDIFGNTPIDDLIQARVERAKNLLTYGRKTTEEIAEELGYLNTTHFIRQFKSCTGVSPQRYRGKRN